MEDGGRRMEGWRIGVKMEGWRIGVKMEGWRIGVKMVFLDRGTGWEYGRRGGEVAEGGSAEVQR